MTLNSLNPSNEDRENAATTASTAALRAVHTDEQIVPAFDYRMGMAAMRGELLAAIERVLNSGCLILGPEVAAFENEFAHFIGATHAVGTSSGTDALIIALRALGIGAGDEVITVSNGPVPTIAAIRAVGAVPRFVDIDSGNLQIDPQLIEDAITAQTRCVLPIHLYGWPAPVAAIAEVCRTHNLVLVEDCAQAHGTWASGQHVGTLGAIGCFSFYPTKNLGAFGDAGLCVTHDAALAANLREQACYGFRNDRVAHREGLNCRLDELQAACLRVKLKQLDTALQLRANIAETYRRGLAGTGLSMLPIPEQGRASWHQFVIRAQQREAWIKWFERSAIQVGVHYATPVHRMPAYQWLGYSEGSLPNTEQACREVVSLPLYPELTDAQAERVIDCVHAGLASGLR